MAFVHKGYSCNGCQTEPIIGERWHCYVCKRAGKDFNMCDFCNKKFAHPHKLGTIARNSKKVKEVHRVRSEDKRAGYVVDPNKYDHTPDKLNRRFAANIMKEPLERGGRSKHAQAEDEDFSYEDESDYFADLI